MFNIALIRKSFSVRIEHTSIVGKREMLFNCISFFFNNAFINPPPWPSKNSGVYVVVLHQNPLFYPLPYNPYFKQPRESSHLKTLWEMKKNAGNHHFLLFS